MLDKDEAFKTFEAKGEAQVHEDIAQNRYSEERTLLAEEWFRQKAQERSDEVERHNEASSLEQRATARSAKNAAWTAAIAATIAAVCAIIAIVLHFLDKKP
jgi:type IV secretory pathway component VirB8